MITGFDGKYIKIDKNVSEFQINLHCKVFNMTFNFIIISL